MSKSDSLSPTEFRFALADSIAFLNPDHWDRVVTCSGLFLSRSFLWLLEQHLPGNLSTHYAIIYANGQPVSAVVAQSLEIRVADLSSGSLPEMIPDILRSLGKVSQHTVTQALKQVLLFDNLLPWPFAEENGPAADHGELWPDVAMDLWHFFRSLLRAAEHIAELPVGWLHLRFLICGNLLSTGPHGVAFAEGEDASELWPAVIEALYRIRRSNTMFGESDMIMIKDLTEQHSGAGGPLRDSGFRRFETEPNMVLQLKPSWTSFDDYLNDMKSDYRSRIRKTRQSLNEAGIVLERLDPEQVESMAAEIHGLYHQIHDRQKFRLTTIDETWIPALARQYRDDFRTVVARHGENGKLLGFVTLIRDGDSAFGYYVGFDKETAARDIPLYLCLVYAGVDQAIGMRVSRFVLGRTALGPKAQIGAKPQETYGYLRHRSPALNLAVPSVLAVLPAPQQAPVRHPFK